MRRERAAASYVLPLRWPVGTPLDDLSTYLTMLTATVQDVLVVDGSDPVAFAAHRAAWGRLVRHLPPGPWPGRNRKVAGVVTGLRHARHDRVVIADDDVRYTPAGLEAVLRGLEAADAVRPQNFFRPLPWHARWDTARTLVNRALGADHPGTLAVRRSRVLAAGGYDGDVLFENLELLRTVREAGGTVMDAPGLYVARLPPSAAHFRSQRVRQAYDSFAQPVRLVSELALLPALLLLCRHRAVLLAGSAAAVAVAECGRRRAGGAGYFPATGALWAPVWVLERAVCIWVALLHRVRGGVPYSGGRLRRAASTPGRRAVARRHPLTAVGAAPAGPPGRSLVHG